MAEGRVSHWYRHIYFAPKWVLALVLLTGCKLNDNRLQGQLENPSSGDEDGVDHSINPDVDSAVVLSALNFSVNLSWTLSVGTSSALISYQVGATAPANCTTGTTIGPVSGLTYTVSGLIPETTYSFRICPSSGGGTSQTLTTTTDVYCSGDQLTNSPYANSGFTGIDGNDASKAFAICTPNQLMAIAADNSKYFKLEADLEMEGVAYTSIDSMIDSFNGELDGGFHTIKNLEIPLLLGASGFIQYNEGVIKNLGLINVRAKLNSSSGALAGQVNGGTTGKGIISNCFATGSISGSSSLGGLVGNLAQGLIEDSYFIGSVRGSHYIGGLVGYNNINGKIRRSFAIADVISSDISFGGIGGFVGRMNNGGNEIVDSFSRSNVNFVNGFTGVNSRFIGSIIGGTITNSFYDLNSTCENNGSGSCTDAQAGLTGIDTTAQPNYFVTETNEPFNGSWDFTSKWKTVVGGVAPVHMPYIDLPISAYCFEGKRWINRPFANSGETGIDGSTLNPFAVCSGEHLRLIGKNTAHWNKSFRLEDDLNMAYLLWGTDYTPIGTLATSYSGVFNGNNKRIYNLYYYNSTGTYSGLFGYLSGLGSIGSFDLISPSITGNNNVAAVVARTGAGSSVSGIGVYNGVVSSDGANPISIGGIVGYHNGSLFNISYSGLISCGTGTSRVGGLVADNSSNIMNGYFSGQILGTCDRVGGIAGEADDNAISYVFADAEVNGVSAADEVGLLFGYFNATPSLTHVYYDSTKICTNTAGTNLCTNYGTGIDTVSYPGYFYDVTNLPMSVWDFTNLWQAISGGYPRLKR